MKIASAIRLVAAVLAITAPAMAQEQPRAPTGQGRDRAETPRPGTTRRAVPSRNRRAGAVRPAPIAPPPATDAPSAAAEAPAEEPGPKESFIICPGDPRCPPR